MKSTELACSALASIALAACSGVKYDDPGKVEVVTIDYGSTDLQTLSGDMVESLVASPALSYLENPGKGDDKRIIVVLGARRTFKPNLQKVRAEVVENGVKRIKRIKVSTAAIRQGLVVKPLKRKYGYTRDQNRAG